MQITFSKYHGAGNDFIMIDGNTLERDLEADEVIFLCHRRFGVGADGVIIVEPSSTDHFDFVMKFYNADGSSGAMCSNGSRCAIRFADKLGYKFTTASFSCCAIPYSGAMYSPDQFGTGFPDLVDGIDKKHGLYIDTGAPHLVIFTADISPVDPKEEGRRLRYHPEYAPLGANVNFIEILNDQELSIITYERGVEDLTLACGTGALASAIAYAQRINRFGEQEYALTSQGGTLIVRFNRTKAGFANIEVIGPAVEVFSSVVLPQKLSIS